MMIDVMPVRPIIVIVLCVVAGFVLAACLRYVLLRRRYPLPGPSGGRDKDVFSDLDVGGFVERFRCLIRIPTVSRTDRARRDPSVFAAFQEELVRIYPRVHRQLDREVHGEFGLIYHWPGRDSGKKPVLFLAHYDVVPADENGDETWEEPPFGASVRDGCVWGRGTLDIKCQLAFIMESAEYLLAKDWQPDRDIYFAFGGDEEIGGVEGARHLASLFRARNLSFEFVLDEGGIIATGQLSFLKNRAAALVGLAEKGFVTFKISAFGESGHSSMPVKEGTAVGRLARAVARLEKRRLPARLDPLLADMLERFVPHVPPGLGIVFANLWLTRPLVRYVFSKNRATDSLIRTTQAVTLFRAGEQENILPGEAFCLVNHRILPGDTMDMIRKRHENTLKDKDLVLEDAGNWPANDPITAGAADGSGFRLIRDVLALTHPGVITVPYLVNGSTDSKYYRDLTGQILRFCPLVLTPEDVAAIHGINERISLENLEKGLEFYLRLFLHL